MVPFVYINPVKIYHPQIDYVILSNVVCSASTSAVNFKSVENSKQN
jgi:hypothetical protein